MRYKCHKKRIKKMLNSVSDCEAFTLLLLNPQLSNSWKYPWQVVMSFAQYPLLPCCCKCDHWASFFFFQGKAGHAREACVLSSDSYLKASQNLFWRLHSFWRFKEVWNSSQSLICFYSYLLWKYKEWMKTWIRVFGSMFVFNHHVLQISKTWWEQVL